MSSVAKLARLALISSLCFLPVPSISEERVSYKLVDGRMVSPLEVFKECDLCPEMIMMPPGSFMMGAKRGESRNPFDIFGNNATLRRRGPDELNIIPHEYPRHRVDMDIPFAMGRDEITYEQWMACVEATACAKIPDHWIEGPTGRARLGPTHPVINISYLDIQDYLNWLNEQVGAAVYRLPTEAEWEYAARAGTETRFSQGDELTADQANFSRAATEHVRGKAMPLLSNRRKTVPVSELNAANHWGLRHMSGNVRELTQSCWTDEHLGLRTSSAYLVLGQSQQDCMRVSKGGSFTGAMDYLRPAVRTRAPENYGRNNLGFRVARQFQQSGEE